MFMAMLTVAVNGLSNIDLIETDLRDLAIRHVGYGVKPAHYRKVGDALMWTLGQNFGNTFTPEVRAAWRSVYETLSGLMIEEGYGGGDEDEPKGVL